MKKVIVLTLTINAFTFSQTDSTQSPVSSHWKHSVVGTLTLTQISFTDWTQGGENTFAWAVSMDGKSVHDQEKINWTTNYKFAYGQAKIGVADTRKADDKIDLESVATYKMGQYINPFVAITLKSQFALGNKYEKSSTGIADSAVAVSNFFDPAYITQSTGVGYQPIPEIKTRVGLAVREIVTSKYAKLYADDPTTAALEKTKVEGGLESATNVDWKLAENILFTSKVELFAPLKELEVLTVRSDNTLSAKVSKYVVVNFNIQLINEKPVSPRTQIKQTLALGLSYSFL